MEAPQMKCNRKTWIARKSTGDTTEHRHAAAQRLELSPQAFDRERSDLKAIDAAFWSGRQCDELSITSFREKVDRAPYSTLGARRPLFSMTVRDL
jgi:hypothetical protein